MEKVELKLALPVSAGVEPRPWGRICVGTRLEKQVEADFFITWTKLLTQGLRKGDGTLLERGKPAHWSANSIIRQFLKTPCDTLWFLDSDADIDQDFLNVFRDFEPGWKFDALQAFHCRRGWPPEAIWFHESNGVNLQCMVTDEITEEVSLVGTHCALFRREVFEKIYMEYGFPEQIPVELFEWFTYPRHARTSDEATLSQEARVLGFRLGATTAVKAGHLSKVVTGWETYQEYIDISGTRRRVDRFRDLARLVGEFTGEPYELVMAKALDGPEIAGVAWGTGREKTPAEARAYYGEDFSYIYKVLLWNQGQMYNQIAAPLWEVEGKTVLVVGTGLGEEVDRLRGRNIVDCFDLPGRLRQFAHGRFKDDQTVTWLDGETLVEALANEPLAYYDWVVAIDVLEHIHPEEWEATTGALAAAVRPGGALYAHNNFQTAGFPEHFDNAALFDQWCETYGFTKESELVWRKKQ